MTLWVMKITASPRRLACRTMRSTCAASLTPRAAVGSSRISTRAEMDGSRDRERLALAARQPADQPVAVIDAGDAEFPHRLDRDLVRPPPVVDGEGPPFAR